MSSKRRPFIRNRFSKTKGKKSEFVKHDHYPQSRYQSTEIPTWTIEEMINKWVWRKEKPKVKRAKIIKDNRNLQDIMGELVIRKIHVSARDDEDFFILAFRDHGLGAEYKQRKIIEKMNNLERKNNEKETGISETNKEKESRELDIKRDKIRAEQERKKIEKIEKMKLDFEDNPEKRFAHIRDIGMENDFQTTYVIELRTRVKLSGSKPAFPSPSNGFHDTRSHSMNSKCFYVGQTENSAKERFHTANVNHMGKSTGKVTKHRLIRDDPPYTKSIKSLNELTNSYGFENQKKGKQSSQFEHYVAWALYKAGNRTWGPLITELDNIDQDMKWLGEYPFI